MALTRTKHPTVSLVGGPLAGQVLSVDTAEQELLLRYTPERVDFHTDRIAVYARVSPDNFEYRRSQSP